MCSSSTSTTSRSRHERMLQRASSSTASAASAALCGDAVRTTCRTPTQSGASATFPTARSPTTAATRRRRGAGVPLRSRRDAGPRRLGSDFNGVAGHVGPRFGSDGCGGHPASTCSSPNARPASRRAQQLRERHRLAIPSRSRASAPSNGSRPGTRTFDYNSTSRAHRLLPDLVGDLGAIGLSETDLIRSSLGEGYVEVWERARGARAGRRRRPAAALAALALLRRRRARREGDLGRRLRPGVRAEVCHAHAIDRRTPDDAIAAVAVVAAPAARAVVLPFTAPSRWSSTTVLSRASRRGFATINGSGSATRLALALASGAIATTGLTLSLTSASVAPIRGLQVTAQNGDGTFAETAMGTLPRVMPILGCRRSASSASAAPRSRTCRCRSR